MGCSSAAETPCLVAQSQRGPKSPTPSLRTLPQRVGDGNGAPPTGQPPSQPPPPYMQRGAGRQSGRQVLSERRGCARPDWRVSGTAICPEACPSSLAARSSQPRTVDRGRAGRGLPRAQGPSHGAIPSRFHEDPKRVWRESSSKSWALGAKRSGLRDGARVLKYNKYVLRGVPGKT